MATKQESILYFAYGSNMHLKQMAQRCPSSRLAGTAILKGYRWHINQRGVANIVASPNQYVQGVVFRINVKDRRNLDRYEGYGRFYDRQELAVDFLPSDTGIEAKKLSALAKRFEKGQDLKFIREECQNEEGSRWKHSAEAPENDKTLPVNADKPHHPRPRYRNSQLSGSGSDDLQQLHRFSTRDGIFYNASSHEYAEFTDSLIQEKVLVYLSTNYVEDGTIREEYVERMRNAMGDAAKAGVSLKFLQQNLEPFVLGASHKSRSGSTMGQSTLQSFNQSGEHPRIGSQNHSTSEPSGRQDSKMSQSVRVRSSSSTDRTRSEDSESGQLHNDLYGQRYRKRPRSRSADDTAAPAIQGTWLQRIASYIFPSITDDSSRCKRQRRRQS